MQDQVSFATLSPFAGTMKAKAPSTINPKLLLLGFLLALLLLYLLASGYSSSPTPEITSAEASAATQAPACTKIPPSLGETIIHYATSNVTPQQTLREISVTAKVLERKSPCNFLIFGLGHDSLMWSSLNHGGHTVFLEEDKKWIESVTQRFPTLEAYHVSYDTKVSQADELLESGKSTGCMVLEDTKFSKCPLALTNLPDVFYEVDWDLIMVDAPTGYISEAPGRMGAIYTAGMAARGRRRREGDTDVFVHDVDRVVEDKFSKTFLCQGYLKEEEGRIRHFTIPSHRANPDISFCPS